MYFTSLLAAFSAVRVVTATDPDPTRYSSCWADRGYLAADATIAGNVLSQNNTFEKGTFLAKNACIYNRHESTIVSVCNGNGRNRTITRGEVRRGIDQLTKDCNIDEAGFSGVHVVNNLTFAAYGIYGGKNIKVPPGANPPDTPTRKKSGDKIKRGTMEQLVPAPFSRNYYLKPRQGIDPCQTIGYDGKSRYDCFKKEGHTVNDQGICGNPNIDNNCEVYCEVRRAGFLGLESVPGGQGGSPNLPAISATLAQNTEYTVTHGISVGVDGTFEEVIGAGVTYEWSTSVTTGKTVGQEAQELDDKHRWRWVFFPKYIETCGNVSRRKLSPGPPNPNGAPANPVCTGDTENLPNVCALTPEVDGASKQPLVFWAVRYENDDGTPIPIDGQHASYKDLCKKKDPDGDGQQECAIGGER